ncbi:hypothetical protein LTR02_006184 [Friedmanniomyces endolithicus]|nr:hypothetical protein LTR38_017974 [Friedmanniomyces endolithicus]KAK0773742.1 hypothetical protein LTR75_017051 [Friedmanniomyces endolithicus]KAK0789254.1 hypothetical protein LTR59_009683 [Friedmanniomyces endolithicus]KAK0905952.1 hypothetical protein LTR02_006184 [Friedmanniomyces endolithicus]
MPIRMRALRLGGGAVFPQKKDTPAPRPSPAEWQEDRSARHVVNDASERISAGDVAICVQPLRKAARVSRVVHAREDAVEKDRLLFFETVAAVRSLAMINSPAAFREQLFMNFTTKFAIVSMMTNGNDILDKLHDWFTPHGKAMVAATDCLLLTQYAHDSNQLHQYKSEGTKQHSLAINALRLSLSKPEAVTDDDALSATDALGVCEAMGLRELLTGVPQGQDAWRQHSRGLCTLIKLRGPQCLSTPSEHVHGMVFNAMHAGLGDSITSRKPFPLSGPAWQQALESSCSGRVWCMYHMVCEFPGYLERMDNMHFSKAPEDEAIEVLTGLIDIQYNLQEWLFAWYEEMLGLPFNADSITSYPSFIARHGPLADQFPIVFSFPSFVEAIGMMGYWTMLLLVQEAIYDLSIRSYALEHTTQHQRDMFCANAYESADAICQCAPYYVSPKSASEEGQWQSAGGTLDLYSSMFWSVRWYEKHNDTPKLDFCKSVLEHRTLGQAAETTPVDDWWVLGKVFLLQRLVWRECIGPANCALRRARSASDRSSMPVTSAASMSSWEMLTPDSSVPLASHRRRESVMSDLAVGQSPGGPRPTMRATQSGPFLFHWTTEEDI